MRRPMLGPILVGILAAATSATAQEELEALESELGSVAEVVVTVENQYDRVLEELGFPDGLDALANLERNSFEQLVALTASRLEAHTPGRGSAFLEFLTAADELNWIKRLPRTIRGVIRWSREWFDSGDEATIRSVRVHVQTLNALLVEVRGKLLRIKAVLDRIESELANL